MSEENKKQIKNKNSGSQIILIMLLGAVIILFTFSVYMIISFDKYKASANQKISAMENIIQQQEVNINSNKSEIANCNQNDNKIDIIENKIQDLEAYDSKTKEEINFLVDRVIRSQFINNIQAVAEDEFYINKARFTGDKTLVVDLGTQPVYYDKYEGIGSFSVSDRELKAAVLKVNDSIADIYRGLFDYPSASWDDLEIFYTIKNYEIGTFENGKLLLNGE